jgi:hypothetical protein
MFRIETTGLWRKRKRLVAPTRLAPPEFEEVAAEIGSKPLKARKVGYVAARRATDVETVETRWNGKESTNAARPGDWIATNLSSDCEILRDASGNPNCYVIKADTFPSLYDAVDGENEFGRFFKAKNLVKAVYLSGGFDILAPWGEKQVAQDGYLLFNGKDVYGNNAETFNETYEILH